MRKKALCIMSGGMDSTLSAYMMKEEGYEIIALHFNYDQRTEKKELACFRKICDELDVLEKYEIDLDFFKTIGASALTDKNIEVPTGGIEKGVPITYVPFRNGIFLSISAAIAEKHGATKIAIGVVQEDSSGYPDCRENFINSIEKSINLGTKDETKITIAMPLVSLKKEQIVKEAFEHDVPLHLTWSC
ncbi:MAG: 7-cyano-7-deazaguanine synthase QueC, partial [Campylobacterota bacterium]|nr:7-cyano-7-deazaguanine synthase QueC [Campylobacterota bacterium]